MGSATTNRYAIDAPLTPNASQTSHVSYHTCASINNMRTRRLCLILNQHLAFGACLRGLHRSFVSLGRDLCMQSCEMLPALASWPSQRSLLYIGQKVSTLPSLGELGRIREPNTPFSGTSVHKCILLSLNAGVFLID